MESWNLSVKNQTDAIRGKKYLEALNINCSVEKRSAKTGGCGFVIRIKGEPEKAVRLLSSVGINVIKAFNENSR